MPIQILNISNTNANNNIQLLNSSGTGNTSLQINPASSLGGSAFFNGTTTTRLITSGSSDATLQFGTGSFTIEWWQNMSAGASSFPRVFEQSGGPMVSMEGSSASRTFYFWAGVGLNTIGSITSSLNGVWNHFALVRSGSGAANFKVYRNGVQFGSAITITTNFNNTTSINIGNRASGLASEAYSGSITNFHWVKGVAKYTASFTPTGPLTPISSSTALLLLTTTNASLNVDSSGYNRVILNTGSIFTSSSPF